VRATQAIRLLGPVSALGVCLMAGCAASPGPPAQQRGWPGLPPDCWTQAREYQTDDDAFRWPSRTKIERVAASRPQAVTLSPNRAYYFALSQEPGKSLLVFAEKDRFVRISFTDAIALNDTRWINEKLLYMRVWWGRVAATDLVFDVEQERMVLAESVHAGQIAMEQARQSCPVLGGCRCIPKAAQ
jgi:hypothetical protein